jgi:thermitase
MQKLKEIVASFSIGLIATFSVGLALQGRSGIAPELFRETTFNEPIDVTGVTDESNQETDANLYQSAQRPTAYSTSPGANFANKTQTYTVHGKTLGAIPRRTASQEEIVVAVIDTGCDFHHPELESRIWNNLGETGIDKYGLDKEFNGVDDDDNGFVDDAHGWDFVTNTPAIMDEHGHGTHVAGLIAREGADSRVRLMILKYYDTRNTGAENLAFSTQAMHYAVRMGARIINFSGGGMMKSSIEESVIRAANERNILLVAAAGNEGLNSDFMPFYPAGYELPNILSVAAVDLKGQLLKGSNFGLASVDLAAPGHNLRSLLPRGRHGVMSGTSQAAAFTTGVAAQVLAEKPELRTPTELKAHLLSTSRPLAALAGRTRLGSLVNSAEALARGRRVAATTAD